MFNRPSKKERLKVQATGLAAKYTKQEEGYEKLIERAKIIYDWLAR